MTHITQALYAAVLQKLQDLVPQFQPVRAMADFEEVSAAAFRDIFGDVTITGCWFHYVQAVIKRVNKLGLKEHYKCHLGIQRVVQCLLTASANADVLDDVRDDIDDVGGFADAVNQNQLFQYVTRHWIGKRTRSANGLPAQSANVRDNRSHTNNVLESYHAALRRRVKVSHPNLLTFLGHLS